MAPTVVKRPKDRIEALVRLRRVIRHFRPLGGSTMALPCPRILHDLRPQGAFLGPGKKMVGTTGFEPATP